jgi:hypothetical protein
MYVDGFVVVCVRVIPVGSFYHTFPGWVTNHRPFSPQLNFQNHTGGQQQQSASAGAVQQQEGAGGLLSNPALIQQLGAFFFLLSFLPCVCMYTCHLTHHASPSPHHIHTQTSSQSPPSPPASPSPRQPQHHHSRLPPQKALPMIPSPRRGQEGQEVVAVDTSSRRRCRRRRRLGWKGRWEERLGLHILTCCCRRAYAHYSTAATMAAGTAGAVDTMVVEEGERQTRARGSDGARRRQCRRSPRPRLLNPMYVYSCVRACVCA